MTRKYSSERNGGCVILTNGENIAMFTNPDSGQELPTIKSFQYLFKYLITRNTGPLNQVLSLSSYDVGINFFFFHPLPFEPGAFWGATAVRPSTLLFLVFSFELKCYSLMVFPSVNKTNFWWIFQPNPGDAFR